MFGVVVFLFIVQSSADQSQTVTLTIEDGDIQGLVEEIALSNTIYHSFRGIPYARPPTGSYRFAAPVKNSLWNGTLDATKDKNECVQSRDDDDVLGDEAYGSEDCLYINVYRPVAATSASIPVLVWIHGGAFTGGNSSFDKFGPEYFLEEGLVFVSFNYRLGVFGFLSTEDEACSGNWGIKDQIVALKWVQSNIAYFGGDPNNVTIFGESAGGVSVSLLLQTKQSTGLFHKAIMNSGTTLNLWSLNTRARATAQAIAMSLGVFTSSTRALVERLRTVDAADLQMKGVNAATALFVTNGLRGLPFAPVIEPSSVSGAVFTRSSDNILRAGQFQHVPVMMGFNSNEAAEASGLPNLIRMYMLNYDIGVSHLTPYSLTFDGFVRTLVGGLIKLHYFGVFPIAANMEKLTEFIGDDQFNRPIRRAGIDMAPYVDVYFYVFGYESGKQKYKGVAHGEDLDYLFGHRDISGTALNVSKNMVKLWSNFVKYGNPTPDTSLGLTWLPVNASSKNMDYLAINETLSMQVDPNQAMWEYYQHIFSRYGDKSYSTY